MPEIIESNMSRTRKDYIKVRLDGKILLILTIYSMMMMCIGAGLKSCNDRAMVAREKITNVRGR